MKKNSFFLFLLIVVGCSSDDSNDDLTLDEDTLPQAINSQTAFDGLIINGGTAQNGAPPTPNGSISLEIQSEKLLAVQEEGFSIPFSSSGNATGAYIQITSENGGLVNQYIDVQLSANKSTKKPKLTTGIAQMDSRLNYVNEKENFDDEINVDLNSSFPTGEFCAILCVYDPQGNISAPTEVCLIVDEWGGDSALIDVWNGKRQLISFQGDEHVAITYGEEFCEAGDCFSYDHEILELNENGTFQCEFKFSYTQEGEQQGVNYKFEGNWSHNGTVDQLVLVAYRISFDINLDGETFQNSYDYDLGEGYVEIYSDVALTNNILRMRYLNASDAEFDTETDIDSSWIKEFERN